MPTLSETINARRTARLKGEDELEAKRIYPSKEPRRWMKRSGGGPKTAPVGDEALLSWDNEGGLVIDLAWDNEDSEETLIAWDI